MVDKWGIEPHHNFRDKWFHGNDRELLRQGRFCEINCDTGVLGDISEHDIDGRIRRGYLAELSGDPQKAAAIYESVGFTERVIAPDYEGELLDGEIEHYG